MCRQIIGTKNVFDQITGYFVVVVVADLCDKYMSGREPTTV